MTTRIWRDGKLIDNRHATVPLTGDAALRGISVFEGLLAYWRPTIGRYAVVSLDRHIERLKQSTLLMKLPFADLAEFVVSGIRDLLAIEDSHQVYLRPTVYLKHGYYGTNVDVGMFVSAREVERSSDRPFDCVVSSLRHVSPKAYPHEAKVGAIYAFYRLSRIEAAEAGADEAILVATDGSVAETPGASVFALAGGAAYTPPVSTGILPSITRATAIHLLQSEMGVEVVEESFQPDFLLSADEVFLTGTMDEVRPVRSIDGHQIGAGVSPVGSQLRTLYLDACRNSCSMTPAGTRLFEGRLGHAQR